MKTKANSLRLLALTGAAVLAGSTAALAQTLYVGGNGGNTVVAYNANTSALIPSFSLTVANPTGLALSGNTLYVAGNAGTSVGTYNATTGAAINTTFISGNYYNLALGTTDLYTATQNGPVMAFNAVTGLQDPAFTTIPTSAFVGGNGASYVLVVGNTLYVSSANAGTVGSYNATTGAVISQTFISGATDPDGLAVSGNNLFVSESTPGGTNPNVAEYNLTTGALVNASFVSDTGSQRALAISGNDLFVANKANGTVGEYNLTTGATISNPFVTPANAPFGLAVNPNTIPEPSTWAAMLGGAGLLGLTLRRRFCVG